MPLPGGPSDKAGNRYELRWIVRRLADLVTGRLVSLRIEPPGEDAIEFRCRSREGETAYQVKRGVSGGGHWTLLALTDVLKGFGRMLDAEAELQCVFGSGHAAPELLELTERGRASRSLKEFRKAFLKAKWLAKAWGELRRLWDVDQNTAWHRLRLVSVASIGEAELVEGTDEILRLLFAAPAETTRAVLTVFALDSIHQEVRAADVIAHLARHSIKRVATGQATAVAPTFAAPPPTGIRRHQELVQLAALIDSSKATVFIGGISGIGKSTVASQFAAEWRGPVCWLDGALLSSGVEAVAAIAEFLDTAVGDAAAGKAAPKDDAQVSAAARRAGKVLAANTCLVVWDGIDGDSHDELRTVIDALGTTISDGGAQLITAQQNRVSGKAAGSARMQVARLDKTLVRHLITDAFPDARTVDVEAADDLTGGHPYLLQLLIESASVVDLGTALRSLRSEDRTRTLIASIVGKLPPELKKLFDVLAWLGIPFRSTHIERLGSPSVALDELAARHLIVRAGRDTYRVHELVANLIKAATPDPERAEFHQRAALLLRGLVAPAWLEVRATLRHARAASMGDVAREAGTLLLRYAMDEGQWGLAREAAEGLAPDSVDYYPHFILGKCCRMTGDLERALKHYEVAEANAPTDDQREKARYDRASVLTELGRKDEAEELYTAMMTSADASTRAHVRVALALGLSAEGKLKDALRLLDDALDIARTASSPRTVSEAHHAIARVLIDDEQWERARAHLKEAHAIRLTVDGPESVDILGWFHLFESVLRVERALDNRDGARHAAHGLWRCAVVSGSVPWETNAAHAMCLVDPNEHDPEVSAALDRLRHMGNGADATPSTRATALESLVVCEWSLKHYEAATEAILELLALANEHKVKVPVFGHMGSDREPDENVVERPGGYGLLCPPGTSEEFAIEIVNRILERRPELIQHARVVIGQRARKGTGDNIGTRKKRTKDAPRKRKRKRRGR